MKKVMVFGTFDIFHKGHIHFLRQAKTFGDYLIVVVARDKTVKELKGNSVLHNEEYRKAQIEKSKLADKVILGSLGDKYQVIRELTPDVICLGYDQTFYVEELSDKLVNLGLSGARIERLKSYMPEKYKSSKLRKIENKS
ncbi:adenylyltransferase/cytidyltransferase family protein [Patescibacteria group bacterium]